jgi:hypothetical protein
VLVLQKLLPFVEAISGAQQKLTVRKVTFLPSVTSRTSGESGDGSEWAAKVISNAEQLRAATGVDLAAIGRRLGSGGSPVTLPNPPPVKP